MVLRDRDGSFEPIIVPKRKRRLDGSDQIVLSLTARGLTIGEVAAHVEEVYAARVSKDTISRITEKIVGELAEWSSRPLDAIYPVIFARRDSHVKVRDGQVRNIPFYVVIGVTMSGGRGILGIWAGDGAEGARFWLQIFSEVKMPRHRRGDDRRLRRPQKGAVGGDPIRPRNTRSCSSASSTWFRNSFRYTGR